MNLPINNHADASTALMKHAISDPAFLEHCEKALPGSTARLLTQLEKELSHRRKLAWVTLCIRVIALLFVFFGISPF